MALLVFTLVICCVVLALDAGRLYLERRNLQRVADLVALELAAGLEIHNRVEIDSAELTARADEAAARNGLQVGETNRVTVQQGRVTNTRVFSANSGGDAVNVHLRRTVPGSVIPNLAAILPGVEISSTIDIGASAIAQRPSSVAVSAGTSLLRMSSAESPLLAAILQQLWGNIDLELVGYNGLSRTNISLLDLATSLGLSAFSPQGLLQTQVSVLQIVEASIDKLSGTDLTAELQALFDLRSQPLSSQRFELGKILNIHNQLLTSNDSLSAIVSIGELLNAAVYAANSKIVVPNTTLDVGAAQVGVKSLSLTVNQPPKVAVGPPGCVDNQPLPCSAGNWLTESRPAQLELELPLTTAILGGLLKLDLDLKIATGVGRSSLAKVEKLSEKNYLVQMDSVGAPVSVEVDVALGLLSLDAVGLGALGGLVEVTGSSHSSSRFLEQPGQQTNLYWPGPASTQTVSGGVDSVVDVLADVLDTRNLDVTVTVGGKIPVLGGVLDFLLSPVVKQLLPSLLQIVGGLGTALSDVVALVLDPVLTPLLSGLGIDVGTMEIQVLNAETGSAELVI